MKSPALLIILGLRTLAAVILLPVLAAAWIVQLVLFSPLVLWALLLPGRTRAADPPAPAVSGYRPAVGLFNRLLDISKLYGCNTRNVPYRWALFSESLAGLRRAADPSSAQHALDFGAGTLRDTYELTRLGFHTVACDLSAEKMAECLRFYDWSAFSAPPVCVSGPLGEVLGNRRFHVMTAFDVIEHLHEPETVLSALREHLTDDGLFLITVPNRRTLGERVGRIKHWLRQKRGRPDLSGVPHVQFRTPREWRRFFESQGFTVAGHDMAIGCLVNDVWTGLYALPIRIFIDPVIRTAAAASGYAYEKFAFEKNFYPAWLMKYVDRIDQQFKPLLKGQWAWNLFVLKKA